MTEKGLDMSKNGECLPMAANVPIIAAVAD